MPVGVCETLLVNAEYFNLQTPWVPSMHHNYAGLLPSASTAAEVSDSRVRFEHNPRQDSEAAPSWTHSQTMSPIDEHTGVYKLHLEAQVCCSNPRHLRRGVAAHISAQ